MAHWWLLAAWIGGPAMAQDTWAPGDEVRNALDLQVTERGLDALGDVAVALVPDLLGGETIPIDPISQSQLFGTVSFEMRDLTVGLDIRNIDIEPLTGELSVLLAAFISLGSETEPFTLEFDFFGAGDTCVGWSDPIPADIQLPIAIAVVTLPTGERQFDVTFGEAVLDVSISSQALHFPSCGGLEGLLDVLDFFGVLDLLVDVLGGQISDLLADLETTLEDALGAVAIEQDLELLDGVVSLALAPRRVDITTDGMAILMSGSAWAEQAECIARSDPGGSLRTDTPRPPIADLPAGTEIAALLSDDFTNQLMYAVYRSGAVCYQVQPEDLAGFPLDSSLLTLLGGNAYNEVLPEEPGELVLRARPNAPPVVAFDGDLPIGIEMPDLGLDFITPIEFRMARALDLRLDVSTGIDIDVDPLTGALELELPLGSENLSPRVGEVFVPGTEASIEDNFGNVIDSLVGSILGTVLADSGLVLPQFSGLGVTQIDLGPGGTESDWLEARIVLEQVPDTYGVSDGTGGCAGCGGGCEQGGCDQGCAGDGTDASCSSGCTAAPVATVGGYIAFFLPFWLMRRRNGGKAVKIGADRPKVGQTRSR